MNWLQKWPGGRRSAPGLEWALWKRLPAIFLLGSALPLLAGLLLWWAEPSLPSAAEARELQRVVYELIGLVLLHWTLVLTLAIGCAIVLVMKGPAYVADPYPPPGRQP
jgi:hypothetical protein